MHLGKVLKEREAAAFEVPRLFNDSLTSPCARAHAASESGARRRTIAWVFREAQCRRYLGKLFELLLGIFLEVDDSFVLFIEFIFLFDHYTEKLLKDYLTN